MRSKNSPHVRLVILRTSSLSLIKMVAHDNQDFLIQTQQQNVSSQHYRTQLELMHDLFRKQGVDYVMEKYNVDVIIGPTDSFLSSIATFTGKTLVRSTSIQTNTMRLPHCTGPTILLGFQRTAVGRLAAC